MKKRYLVFAFSYYYPAGGWDDLYEQCDTEQEARLSSAFDGDFDKIQIVDTLTGEVINFAIPK